MHFYVSIEFNYLVNKRYLKKDEIRKIHRSSIFKIVHLYIIFINKVREFKTRL